MAKQPPVSEQDFLRLTNNHNELSRKLANLNCHTPDILEFAKFVCEAWFKLGEEHLAEAKQLAQIGSVRGTCSRAYYAAYNASKAIRYLNNGFVSLKGDDHARASSELPDDFPDAATWSEKLSRLYELRLWADYDNWTTTIASLSSETTKAITDAEAFIGAARTFVNFKFTMTL